MKAAILIAWVILFPGGARASPALDERISRLYQDFSSHLASGEALPPVDHFRHAALAYCKARESGVPALGRTTRFAFVDYSEPSDRKRLYLFDFGERRLLDQTFATHAGSSSGFVHFYEEDDSGLIPYSRRKILSYGSLSEARFFSARPGSTESSLGLAVSDTLAYASSLWGDPALRLNGLDGALNSSLRTRGVVFHAFNYSEDEVKFTRIAPLSEGCLMFPGVDQTRKWVEQLKGTPVALFHERGVSPEKNEELYQEERRTHEELRSRVRERLIEMAADLGWDEAKLRDRIGFYEDRLKKEWLDRATETHLYTAQRSRFFNAELKNEAACFAD